MSARHNFRRTMGRVDGLIDLNVRLSKQGHPPKENSDVLRAAVVLSLGALDALVVDALVEAVPEATRRGKLGPRTADWLSKDGARSLAIICDANPHRAMAAFVAEKLSNTTFQRSAIIDDNLHEILGVPPSWSPAARRVGGKMTADELQTHLNHFSDRRNQIAHKGDVKAGTRAGESINRDWVERHVGYVRETGEAICDGIGKLYGPRRGRPKARK